MLIVPNSLKNKIEIISQVGGFNSSLFKIKHNKYGYCALKKYSSTTRMKHEAKSYHVLHKSVGSFIPLFYEYNLNEQYALLEWIEGEPLDGVSYAEIDAIINFIENLKKINTNYHISAVDACVSPSALLCLVERRYKRLCELRSPFLREILSQLEHVIRHFSGQLTNAFSVVAIRQDLSDKYNIYSPSDFSFANIIKRNNGKLCFIDFEYFGRDDPVKLISDFIWHPKNSQLSRVLKLDFLKKTCELFKEDPEYELRFKAYFPLFGVIWVMILLNLFIPEVWEEKKKLFLVKEEQKEATLDCQLNRACEYMKHLHKLPDNIVHLDEVLDFVG